MKYNFTKIFTLALCILFAFSAISFADTYEEKVRAKAEDGDAYVKSNHNYTPRFTDKAGLALEDFESGIFPPTGWTEFHTGVDGLDISAVQAFSPDSSAFFNDVFSVDTSWFVTPQILALDTNSQLTFYQYQNFDFAYDYHAIWVSTASADPASGDFVEVDSLGAGTEDTWEFKIVDLSAYAGQDVYVAFVYYGDFADEWFLDDIAVAPPAAYDIGVASVYTETSDLLIPGANVTVNAIVQNFGADDATGFNVDLSVDDGHTETYLFSGTLVAGTTDTVTFTNPWVPASGGSFELTSFTEWGDADPSNDTSSVTVDIISIEPLDFEEHFEDYTTVPNSIGWLGDPNTDFGTFVPNTTNDGLWRNRDFGNDPTLTNSARVNLYGATTNDGGWLITPPIDMTTGGPNNMLSFDAAITPWTGTDSTGLNPEDSIYIVVSTDGMTWDRSNIIASYNSTSVVMPGGTHYDIDLSAWDNETALHIGLLAIDNAGPNDKLFFIDNILIAPPPIATPFFEDFETGVTGVPGTLPAGWTNDTDDDQDWYVDSGGTGSPGTGPAVDHTLGTAAGIYIYTEASSGRDGMWQHVTSPRLDVSGLANPALSFWYHMAGGSMGDLHVDVYDGMTWHLDVADVLSGPQQGVETDPWLMKTADLSGYGNTIKVRFRGLTGGGWASDMAVDDVTIDDASTIPYDIIAQGIEAPVYSMIPLTQPSLTSALELRTSFANQASDNTGDVTVEIYDTTGTIVFTDGDLGVTIPGFSSQSFSYVTDASDADSGMTYTAAIFATNFTDTIVSNDTSWAYPVLFGDQMGYDQGIWRWNLAVSSPTGRTQFTTRFDLLDDDVLTDVTLALGSGTATDSISIDLYTNDADTPSVMLHRIFRGTIADAGGPSALVTFTAPDIPLPAGDYWVVLDLDAVTGYPIGADTSAITPVALPHHFAMREVPGDWIYLENSSFGLYTPIWRIGLSGAAGEQVVFFDDFESGTGQWALEGTWGTTTLQSYSPTQSLTESPTGNYAANLNISATMVNGVDLSGADVKGASMSFMAMGSIESGNFDYMYVEASNDGSNWLTLDAIFGEPISPTFINFAYPLGAFIGDNDVKVRFRFFSDGGYEVDGMYIDDFMITTTSIDTVAPVIVHDGPDFYEGVPGDFSRMADFIDVSGIGDTEIGYSVEGGAMQYISPDTSMGATYYFTIPEQAAGSNVEYEVTAEDTVGNVGTYPEIFKYISGTHLFYANPEVTFIQTLNPGTGIAVRFSVPTGEEAQLVTGLIRNYTDQSQPPNGQILVHVWDDNAGLPGNDIITPFLVRPEANLVETSRMTRVDLRPYAAQLSNMTGDFHIGFTVPDTAVIHTYNVPTTAAGRSSLFTGTWAAVAANDYHVRAVVVLDTLTSILGDDLLPAEFALRQNYPNPFNPSTTIKYALKTNVDVKLTIYNILGQEIRTLINNNMAAGYKEVVWNGLDNNGLQVATGVYIYRIEAGDFVKSRKMIFMK